MKLGIIGGLGPLASAYLLELLTTMTEVTCDQDHLEVLLHSTPQIPDRTTYILDHTQADPLPKMIEVGQTLSSLGVSYIVIPCITAHYFYHPLHDSISAPIISIVHEVAVYLEVRNIRQVGLMATDGTVKSEIFQRVLKRHGIDVILPDEAHQKMVMKVIYENVKLGKEIEQDVFFEAASHLFDQGAKIIILGCTELSIGKKELNLDNRFLDCLDVVAAVALDKCGKKLKKEYQYLIEKE